MLCKKIARGCSGSYPVKPSLKFCFHFFKWEYSYSSSRLLRFATNLSGLCADIHALNKVICNKQVVLSLPLLMK